MGATGVGLPHGVSASTEQMLDSSPDAVVIVDSAGLIRLVNRRAESLFGYTRHELLGQAMELLVPEHDQGGRSAGSYRNPKASPIGAGLDTAALRKDGTELLVDVSFSLLETDDELFLSAAIRDSSERTRIEAKVQSSEATSHLAAIVESSEDAIIGKDLDGCITAWNQGAEHLYGYAADEMLGHNISELMPEDLVRELAPILERVRHGERVEHYETKRIHNDGRMIDVSVTVSPVLDENGVVTGASSVARDLTKTKQTESDHRALEAQLHQAQRLESLGQLAGGVAHDFNNLLAGIMNYAYLVSENLQEMSGRRRSEDEAFATVIEDVAEITSVAKRAAALTHQLLVFSRREVVRPEVLDLNSVVVDMEDLLRTTIGENVEELQTALESDLPLVKADRGQVEQVLMNLAVNARDAMPGGGRLVIETATFEVDEQYARLREINLGTYAQLSVSDTGTGMSQEVADRAFDPFFTTKRTDKGTGLGLATVYGIVTQAGGDVAIYSEPGLGTTIRVRFPATAEARSKPRDTMADLPLSGNGETVLLVEDEDIVREPARRMLARHGYTVLAARSADEALAIVREHRGQIDLLLTDVVMPVRSGKELSVDVAALRPDTKVLFMSGYSQDVILSQDVLEKGVSLIEKPFSADDLLRSVRDVLDRDSR
jgi:PAS domain S-box-containing protein